MWSTNIKDNKFARELIVLNCVEKEANGKGFFFHNLELMGVDMTAVFDD